MLCELILRYRGASSQGARIRQFKSDGRPTRPAGTLPNQNTDGLLPIAQVEHSNKDRILLTRNALLNVGDGSGDCGGLAMEAVNRRSCSLLGHFGCSLGSQSSWPTIDGRERSGP